MDRRNQDLPAKRSTAPAGLSGRRSFQLGHCAVIFHGITAKVVVPSCLHRHRRTDHQAPNWLPRRDDQARQACRSQPTMGKRKSTEAMTRQMCARQLTSQVFHSLTTNFCRPNSSSTALPCSSNTLSPMTSPMISADASITKNSDSAKHMSMPSRLGGEKTAGGVSIMGRGDCVQHLQTRPQRQSQNRRPVAAWERKSSLHINHDQTKVVWQRRPGSLKQSGTKMASHQPRWLSEGAAQSFVAAVFPHAV